MNNETETSTNQWDLLTRVLHWISAIWVSGLIGLGLIMVNLVHASGLKFELFQLHKSYGFVFGFILIARLVWKLMSRRPKAAGTGLLQLKQPGAVIVIPRNVVMAQAGTTAAAVELAILWPSGSNVAISGSMWEW